MFLKFAIILLLITFFGRSNLNVTNDKTYGDGEDEVDEEVAKIQNVVQSFNESGAK